MSVEFDEQDISRSTLRYLPNQKDKSGSKLGDWLIRNEFVKTPDGANLIILIAGLICFAVSFYIFVNGFNLPFQDQNTTAPSGNFPPANRP